MQKRSEILVVDDEVDLLEVLAEEIKLAGFEPLLATAVDEGLELLRSHTNVCMVLSDLMMPGKGGLELLRQARDHLGDQIPIVAMTALLDQDPAKLLAQGFQYVLAKPFDFDLLKESLRLAAQSSGLVTTKSKSL